MRLTPESAIAVALLRVKQEKGALAVQFARATVEKEVATLSSWGLYLGADGNNATVKKMLESGMIQEQK